MRPIPPIPWHRFLRFLNIEIGGPNVGSDFDQLAISGQATLDGTLNVSLLHGFTPMHGQTFALVTFAGHTGTFARANVGSAFMTPRYDSGDVTLVAN